MIVFLFFFAVVFGSSSKILNLKDFGAIPNEKSLNASQINSMAIEKAFQSANGGGNILVGADEEYFIFHTNISNVSNVTLTLDGTLRVYDGIDDWKAYYNGHSNALYFNGCKGLFLNGNGLMDGIYLFISSS